MMAENSRGRSRERAKTDRSLRTERQNTDDALQGDRASTERDADGAVDQARASADAVVRKTRHRADQEKRSPKEHSEAAAVVSQRARDDRAVHGERVAADVVVRSGREEQADVLNALLVHERAATDAFLLTERARSDDAVDNRDDFLGMVAHDVRNLLNLVVLSLEMQRPAESDPATDPIVAATASRVRRYVARMNRLIGDLVDVTSIDAGKLAVEAIEADAAALLTEAAEAFRPAALEQGVMLTVKVPATPMRAPFDHDRMLQVLSNVIANAIKFTPREGTIDVGVEEAEGMLRFCISDTGVGIPSTMLEAIFERFWQVGKNDRRGMGLGLYISKCIVQAHGGRIWAESEPGKGSQLYFTLPAGPAQFQRRHSPS
jgi:signal transduction histidine kinase